MFDRRPDEQGGNHRKNNQLLPPTEAQIVYPINQLHVKPPRIIHTFALRQQQALRPGAFFGATSMASPPSKRPSWARFTAASLALSLATAPAPPAHAQSPSPTPSTTTSPTPSPAPQAGVEQLQAIAAIEALLPEDAGPPEIRKLDTLYLEYIRSHPSDARGYSLHGAFLAARKEPKRAMVQLQRAIALQPKVAEYHLQFASASMLAGESVPAILAYRAAVALAPQDAQLHADLATHLALFRRDLVEAAVDASETAVLEEALAHYAKAASLAPGNAELWRAYAESFQYFPSPDLDAATKAWEAFLALTPDKDFARLQLARVAIQRKDGPSATAHLAAIQDSRFFVVRDKLAKKAEALAEDISPPAP